MTIGAAFRYSAALVFTLTLGSVASAEPRTTYVTTLYDSYGTPYYVDVTNDLCPDSHGVAGNGYRGIFVRPIPDQEAAPERGVALPVAGYRDMLARFPQEARSRGIQTRAGVVAGFGYRNSLARFPGPGRIEESPRNAVARCGQLDTITY